MPKKIVVIGGGTAGASAALTARKIDRTAEITVLEQEPFPTYSRCGLPFAIKGIIPSPENLVVFPYDFFRKQKINYLGNAVAEKIIPAENIIAAGGKNHPYDSLIITTGSSPVKPPINGVNLPHVFTLRTINDAKQIISHQLSVISHQLNAVIIGASFIGLELAEALKTKGCAVTLVEAARLMWRNVDSDIGLLISRHLTEQGINLIEQNTVTEIKSKEIAIKSQPPSPFNKGDKIIPAELVVVAAGVKPETRLAREAGIAIGQTGGIKTDNRLQTSIKNIYAAGDCAEVESAITGEPITIGLGTIAARQGVAAGTNATGGSASGGQPPPPVLNSAVLKVFGLEIGSVGFTEEYLKKNHPEKFNPVSMTIKYPSLPHYYPGGTDIHVKLIADEKTHRLLGGQITGRTALAPRVNTIALAVGKKMTAEELIQSDFCYSPPVADIWDPLAVAAQALLKKLDRDK